MPQPLIWIGAIAALVIFVWWIASGISRIRHILETLGVMGRRIKEANDKTKSR